MVSNWLIQLKKRSELPEDNPEHLHPALARLIAILGATERELDQAMALFGQREDALSLRQAAHCAKPKLLPTWTPINEAEEYTIGRRLMQLEADPLAEWPHFKDEPYASPAYAYLSYLRRAGISAKAREQAKKVLRWR
ncbi:MAG: hypothetical protein JRD89_00890 [Deltaproteobacteria bacterium]|nr:hypothetical protein [Deltaproteobacteria bacterium]